MYIYHGLADPDEASFASNIALQAYFEGRKLTHEEMNKCVQYYQEHIVPKPPPPRDLRKTSWLFRFLLAVLDFVRSVLKGEVVYRMTHPVRNPPYKSPTPETNRVYELYAQDREKDLNRFYNMQMHDYIPPRSCGCDRWFGRKGVFFCTEDIDKCFTHKKKSVAPPLETPFAYDLGEYSAADVLRRVVGPPPAEVVHRCGPYAPDADQAASSLIADEESGFSHAGAGVGASVGQPAVSVNRQPVYVPKSEPSVEMQQPENIDLPV